MALHLLLIIVLGSILVPASSRQYLSSQLLLSFVELNQSPPETEVLLASSEPIDSAESKQGEAATILHDDNRSLDDDSKARLAELSEAEEQAPLIAARESDLDRPAPEAVAAAPGGMQQSRLLPGPFNDAGSARIPPPDPASDLTPQKSSALSVDADEQRQFDDAVDRFIEFDVGRLEGAEGVRARLDFERLGDEAIPALVRGLNKSAKIYASCPVVVISNKLALVMSENRDPATLQYVADHLGEGVPKNAPHIARIRALKNQLLRGVLGPDGEPLEGDELPAQPLAKMLNGSSEAQHLEAARQVSQHAAEILAGDRADVAWALIRRLSDRNLQVRKAAREALVALADGEDLGPFESPATAKDVAAAASRWYARFDQQRYEAMAAGVLASARHFEEVRRKSAAMRYYRKLIDEYEGTAAAEEASKHLESLTTFQLR